MNDPNGRSSTELELILSVALGIVRLDKYALISRETLIRAPAMTLTYIIILLPSNIVIRQITLQTYANCYAMHIVPCAHLALLKTVLIRSIILK